MAPGWDDRSGWSGEHTGWGWSWHGWHSGDDIDNGWSWHTTEPDRTSSDRASSDGGTWRWRDTPCEVTRSTQERPPANNTRQSRRPPSRFRSGQLSELWKPDDPTLGKRLEAEAACQASARSSATSSALPSLPLTELGGSPHQPTLDEADEVHSLVNSDVCCGGSAPQNPKTPPAEPLVFPGNTTIRPPQECPSAECLPFL